MSSTNTPPSPWKRTLVKATTFLKSQSRVAGKLRTCPAQCPPLRPARHHPSYAKRLTRDRLGRWNAARGSCRQPGPGRLDPLSGLVSPSGFGSGTLTGSRPFQAQCPRDTEGTSARGQRSEITRDLGCPTPVITPVSGPGTGGGRSPHRTRPHRTHPQARWVLRGNTPRSDVTMGPATLHGDGVWE